MLKPQKQITLRSTGAALHLRDDDLPPDALLIPWGTGSPMSIFGLADEPMTSERFLEMTAGVHRDSWREAITSVILSSLPDRLSVDNSQIVLSSDESKTYRVVLTTATKYWDDSREFNLYFVETLRREEYGDQATTQLLKGLELVCRYRFMFLEPDSEFAPENILATNGDRLLELASALQRELNLMRKESLNAGLDRPKVWHRFVGWPMILQMGKAYRPRETAIREVLGRIAKTKGDSEEQEALRAKLAEEIDGLGREMRPMNRLLIESMANTLLDLVREEDERSDSKVTHFSGMSVETNGHGRASSAL